MADRPIAPILMWCVAVIGKRTTWLHHWTINRTRKGAANEYLANWLPEYQARIRRERNKKWRVVRVMVSAE